jgi:hypothetical protein
MSSKGLKCRILFASILLATDLICTRDLHLKEYGIDLFTWHQIFIIFEEIIDDINLDFLSTILFTILSKERGLNEVENFRIFSPHSCFIIKLLKSKIYT